MAAKTNELCYKGHPLRRKDNLLYYGSMADKYIIMMQILDTKNPSRRRDHDDGRELPKGRRYELRHYLDAPGRHPCRGVRAV